MKHSQNIGIIAAIALIGSCFLPWVSIPSLDLTLNGYHAKVNEALTFGDQWISHSFFAILSILLFAIPVLMAKRINIFVACVNLGWALKNYIIFSMCRQGICPEVKIGLILVIVFSITIMVMSLLPDIAIKPEQD